MAKVGRDYILMRQLQDLDDDTLIGANEMAALLGLSSITIRHRKVRGLPLPLEGFHLQRWRIGTIRSWIRGQGCRDGRIKVK